MPDLTISDLSFCELATEKNLDNITGGETPVTVYAVSGSISDGESSSGYAFVQVSRNYPSPEPVSPEPVSPEPVSPEPVIDGNYFKLREFIINKFNNINLIQPIFAFKFQD